MSLVLSDGFAPAAGPRVRGGARRSCGGIALPPPEPPEGGDGSSQARHHSAPPDYGPRFARARIKEGMGGSEDEGTGRIEGTVETRRRQQHEDRAHSLGA